MIRVAKKTARTHLKKDFKHYILPTFLHLTSAVISYAILNLVLNIAFSHLYNDYIMILAIVLLLASELLFLPLSLAIIYKIAQLLDFEPKCNLFTELKKFFNFSFIVKIFMINFIPRFINLCAEVCSLKFSILDFLGDNRAMLPLILIVSTVIGYLFIPAKYYLIFENLSVKDSIINSLKFMSRKFFKFIGLSFSFCLWYILAAIINLALGYAFFGPSFSANTFAPLFTIIFKITGYGGIFFYLLPYMTLSEIYLIKELTIKKGKS